MLKKTAVLAAASAAGLMAMAPLAMADSHDNDGINVLNDNNLSVLPVQLCGNDIAIVGAIVELASPDVSNCVNAPITEDSGNNIEIEHEIEHKHDH